MENLKQTLLACCLCFSLFCEAQQVTLHGQVSVRNSHYETGKTQYVKRAEVRTAQTASVKTNRKGQFTLIFSGGNNNAATELSVKKKGLKVTNMYDLPQTVIVQEHPLLIFMDTPEKLSQSQAAFIFFGKNALQTSHNRRLSILQKEGHEKDLLIAELNKELNLKVNSTEEATLALEKQLKKAEEKLPAIVRELAYINLDAANDTYIGTYEHLRDGKIHDALVLLNDTMFEYETIAAASDGRTVKELRQAADCLKLKAKIHFLLLEYHSAAQANEKCIILLQKWRNETLELADVYEETAYFYENLGRYPPSLDYRQKAFTIRKKMQDPMHPDIANSCNSMAEIYRHSGKYDIALLYSLLAQTILEKKSPSDDASLAALYTDLATTYQALGQPGTSLEYQQKALTIRERTLTPDDPLLAETYNSLSGYHRKSGQYKMALEYQLKALNILENKPGTGHLYLAGLYENAGNDYQSLHQFNESLSHHLKALSIREQALNANHPSLAVSYNTLAQLYLAQAQYDQALENQLKALDIFKKTLGPQHANIGAMHNNIASIYLIQNQYDQALESQFQALRIFEKVLNPAHPTLITIYKNLGKIYQETGQYDLAVEYLLKGNDIQKLTLAPNHPDIASFSYKIGVLYQIKREYEKAGLFYEKAYDIWKVNPGEEHPDTKMAKRGIDQVNTQIKAVLISEKTTAKPLKKVVATDSVSIKKPALGIAETGSEKEQKKSDIPLIEDKSADRSMKAFDETLFQISQTTSLREQPNSKSGVLKRLSTGTKVRVLEKTQKYWWKVDYNGQTGFVKALLLSTGEALETAGEYYQVTQETSLRTQATASSKVLKRLGAGTRLTVTEKTGKFWWKVEYNGRTGYVKALLLEKAK